MAVSYTHLRAHETRHDLVCRLLLEKKKANALDIANSLGISPSTLSWYLKQLTEKNVISQRKKGRFRYYSVVDKEKIMKYLIMHKSSFLDDVVDRFIEAWEE